MQSSLRCMHGDTYSNFIIYETVSMQQNHLYDTLSNFTGQAKKKVTLALKCMDNYKFSTL